MLELRLLGQFDIRLDQQTTEIPNRQAQSLLAYLALNPGIAHRREKLAGLLWPDSPESISRRNLRQALWHIRRVVNAGQIEVLRSNDLTVTLEINPQLWIDTSVLGRKVAPEWSVEDLLASITVYRGELLPGFYDEWIVPERERQHLIFEQKITLLVNRLIEQRRWRETVEWAESWISLGNGNELAFRAIMTAYDGLGDLPNVYAAFRRCQESLRREIGVDPSPETVQLFNQLMKAGKREQPLLEGVEDHLPVQDPEEGIASSSEPPAPGSSPYKGLEFFDEADAAIFFGREVLVAQLAAKLRASASYTTIHSPRQSECRMMVVVGSSGSGKSSLLRAGLIPELRKERDQHGSAVWQIYTLTPTAHPLVSLAHSLTPAAESILSATRLCDDFASDPRSLQFYFQRKSAPKNRSHNLIFIDQFEELFSLCQSEAERTAFIQNLAVAAENNQVSIILALRADFYPACAQYPELRKALAACQELLGPMEHKDLRRAIEEPARQNGWLWEPGLVDLILRDAGIKDDAPMSGIPPEPGALPLLSHALLMTWERRQGRILTLSGYTESGGVSGAIARTAESVYARLSPEQQQAARRIFLRLTTESEAAADSPVPVTRRQARIEELTTASEDSMLVNEVLSQLNNARLIILQEGAVDVAHEALLREWPRLHQWLEADREGRRIHRRLMQAVKEWEAMDRDPQMLYRGAQLTQALDWAASNDQDLNLVERQFLITAKEFASREIAEFEEHRQRELEMAHFQVQAARRLAEVEAQRALDQTRSSKRLHRLLVGISAALLLAVLFAALAIMQRQNAMIDARQARSRELAAAAISNLSADPERSILLSLHALSEMNTREAENALHRSVHASRLLLTLNGHQQAVNSVSFSPDGQKIASASQDATVVVWETASGKPLLSLKGHTGGISEVSFDPGGGRIASAGNDGTVRFWNASTGDLLLTLDIGGGFVGSAVFSPDGDRLATGGEDGTIRIWDSNSGEKLVEFYAHNQPIHSLDFSPDGRYLATASEDGSARIWDSASGRILFGSVLTVSRNGIDFCPDGESLAIANDDHTAEVLEIFEGTVELSLTGHYNTVNEITFSPDGNRLATGSSDGQVIIWQASSGRALLTLSGHQTQVHGLAFHPNGSLLASANADGTIQLWNLGNTQEVLAVDARSGSIFDVAYSPDGVYLLTAGEDERAHLWNAETGEEVLRLPGHSGLVFQATFSPDGRRIATASSDGTVRIWDIGAGRSLLTLSGHQKGLSVVTLRGALSAAFSPDGSNLATGGADGTIRIWDAVSGQVLHRLQGHNDHVRSVAYSPDGRLLASASDDRTARLWDAATGDELQKLDGHIQGVLQASFSPDGRLLATASADATVIIWDIATGNQLRSLAGHIGAVNSVVFSPDGSKLATAGSDRTTRIWDLSSGVELITLPARSAPVYRVAFSPDGTRLASSGADGIIRVDFTQVEDLIQLAEQRITRQLTPQECERYLHKSECYLR